MKYSGRARKLQSFSCSFRARQPYSDPGLLGQLTATVSELLGGVTNLLSWTFTAPINHFSGYIVLCGRE